MAALVKILELTHPTALIWKQRFSYSSLLLGAPLLSEFWNLPTPPLLFGAPLLFGTQEQVRTHLKKSKIMIIHIHNVRRKFFRRSGGTFAKISSVVGNFRVADSNSDLPDLGGGESNMRVSL